MNTKAKRRFVAVAVALGCLALSSPFIASELVLFSHSMHIDEDAECSQCHVETEDGSAPSVNKEYCTECHDDGVPSYRLPARAVKMGGGFPHGTHVDAAECKDCHEATITETQKAGALIVPQEKCTACHKAKNVKVSSANCGACHPRGRRQKPPSDHEGNWLLKHGAESRWSAVSGHTKDCSSCHRRDACATCHRTKRPQSHTGLWRLRGHGLAAGWDRNSCRTCHETGACISCHKTNRPLNHSGAWSTYHSLAAEVEGNSHCAVCHSPGYCISCHKGK